MIPVLPTAISSAVKFPKEAAALSPEAIFQLGRLASSNENRAWAREKVRQSQAQVNGQSPNPTQEALAQLHDRKQVLMSLERFYKKMRHETFQRFPESLAAMEAMLPGSITGLFPVPPKLNDPLGVGAQGSGSMTFGQGGVGAMGKKSFGTKVAVPVEAATVAPETFESPSP